MLNHIAFVIVHGKLIQVLFIFLLLLIWMLKLRKTKVLPMKEVTIPRLEFMSCVLLTKLLQSVLKGLSLNTASIYCWSDSMIALHWIKINKKWKIWVQNRVDIIKKVVKPDNWRYISSSDNPADIATRECLPNSIVNNKLC